MTWKVCGSTDLPLGDREREWDERGARDRIFEWAGWEANPRPSRARQGFFAYDNERQTNLTAYKLPFADVMGDHLLAMPRGLFAVAQLLGGARDGIDLPEDLLRSLRTKVTTYYHKMGEKAPWEEPSGEMEKAMPGKLTAGKREKRERAAHTAVHTRMARGTQRTGSKKQTPQEKKKRLRAAKSAARTRRMRAT